MASISLYHISESHHVMADITSLPTHQINSTMKPPLPPHFDFGTPPPSPPRTSSSSRTSLAPSINFTSLSDKYSTAKPWYYTTIEKRLGSEARDLLENYSQIPPDKVDDHVYKMVSKYFHSVSLICLYNMWFDFYVSISYL